MAAQQTNPFPVLRPVCLRKAQGPPHPHPKVSTAAPGAEGRPERVLAAAMAAVTGLSSPRDQLFSHQLQLRVQQAPAKHVYL